MRGLGMVLGLCLAALIAVKALRDTELDGDVGSKLLVRDEQHQRDDGCKSHGECPEGYCYRKSAKKRAKCSYVPKDCCTDKDADPFDGRVFDCPSASNCPNLRRLYDQWCKRQDICTVKNRRLNISKTERLGGGDNGKVYPINRDRAIKVVPEAKLDSWDAWHDITNESAVMRLNLPFCNRAFQFYFDQHNFYFVMPRANGTLMKQIPVEDARVMKRMAQQLAHGLYKLHKAGWIHRDLKPENILYKNRSNEIVAYIHDFGDARHASRLQENWDGPGTPGYMAPAVLSLKSYGPEVDWFGLGVTYFEMVTEELPWKEEVEKQNKEVKNLDDAKIEAIVQHQALSSHAGLADVIKTCLKLACLKCKQQLEHDKMLADNTAQHPILRLEYMRGAMDLQWTD